MVITIKAARVLGGVYISFGERKPVLLKVPAVLVERRRYA